MNHVILSVILLSRRKQFDFFFNFTFLENKSLLKESSLKIGEEQECRIVR